MPTKTFFNLPEEKRNKLLEAIHEEFSRVSFEEVSINQIIRMAGIPRGSFYQYFEDKKDMLRYLLSDYQEMLKGHALVSLERNGGDLFQMFLDIFDFTYGYVTEEKNNAFFKNLFADISVNAEFLRHRAHKAGQNTFGEFIGELLPYIDMDALDIRNEDDFGNMLGVLLPLTGEAFTTAFFDISGYAQIRLRYTQRLELLKRGFLKAKGAKT
ncbi:MAG: TetR/AcrR family transcriptional regulator [Clostridia bacterium]|jgi:AcrR family transcriptional regulator|nr:TetR/AcrR family transcriptional regulator [Clostridia bacterium]